jgi:hypothetical protein
MAEGIHGPKCPRPNSMDIYLRDLEYQLRQVNQINSSKCLYGRYLMPGGEINAAESETCRKLVGEMRLVID